MLPYVLAWVIGLDSLGLYLAAFFLPEIHRKNDFIWSGLGLFYALVLWVYAQRITGGILLGQTASVALTSWLGWETLKLRRQVTPLEQQTKLPDTTALQAQASSMQQKLTKQSEKITSLFTKAKNQIQATSGAASNKDKSTQAAQPSQTPSVAVRDTKPLEKDKLEVPPPAATDEAVAQDQIPAEAAPITEEIKPKESPSAATDEALIQDKTPTEAAPITEEVKPEIEVTPQSTTDEVIAEPDQETSAEVTPTAKGVEPKIAETKVASKDTQIKAASTKDNLQAKLAELQTKLTDLPIRESWNKLSKQATGLFSNAKERVQGIISTVTQRQSTGVKTTQQPTAPPTTAGSTTVQDSDADQAKSSVETASAIVMDEAVTGSTPVEDVELKVAEETASLTSEATTDSETTTELEQPESSTVIEEVVTETESVSEANSVASEATLTNEGPTPAAEEATVSDQSAQDAEVEALVPNEELAPEVEVATEDEIDWPPKTESDWPPEPEPDWSSEPEPPVTMEAAPSEAASTPEAPPSTPVESPPSEDKVQKQNPSNSP